MRGSTIRTGERPANFFSEMSTCPHAGFGGTRCCATYDVYPGSGGPNPVAGNLPDRPRPVTHPAKWSACRCTSDGSACAADRGPDACALTGRPRSRPHGRQRRGRWSRRARPPGQPTTWPEIEQNRPRRSGAVLFGGVLLGRPGRPGGITDPDIPAGARVHTPVWTGRAARPAPQGTSEVHRGESLVCDLASAP